MPHGEKRRRRYLILDTECSTLCGLRASDTRCGRPQAVRRRTGGTNLVPYRVPTPACRAMDCWEKGCIFSLESLESVSRWGCIDGRVRGRVGVRLHGQTATLIVDETLLPMISRGRDGYKMRQSPACRSSACCCCVFLLILSGLHSVLCAVFSDLHLLIAVFGTSRPRCFPAHARSLLVIR